MKKAPAPVLPQPPTASTVVTNDIRDIKPPVEIPSGWAWLGWTLAVLVLAAAALAAWRRWRKQKAAPSKPAVVTPPHERARRKLQEALRFLDQPKPFCILVSDAVRLYLEERFALNAPERTTEEFLNELQFTTELTAAQKLSLADFLNHCDLVKFARAEPPVTVLQGLYESALRLIAETEPRPLPDAAYAAVASESPRATVVGP